MRTTARVVASLTLVAGLALIDSSPAASDHQNHFTHWGHDYSPLVTANCGLFGGTLCQHTTDAENFWRQNGFWPGFRGGQQWWGCGSWGGWISVCQTTRAELNAMGGRADTTGAAFPFYTQNPTTHINAFQVFICIDCGMNPTQVRDTTRHEYGHAIGLGHNLQFPASVMASPIGCCGALQHDRDAVQWMYTRHDDTIFSGQRLDGAAWERLRARNAQWEAVMQNDGNFVVYGPGGAHWATNTNGWPNVRAEMQWDCNFVLYSNGTPIWATNTWGRGSNCFLTMQTDGNLVLSDGRTGARLWSRF